MFQLDSRKACVRCFSREMITKMNAIKINCDFFFFFFSTNSEGENRCCQKMRGRVIVTVFEIKLEMVEFSWKIPEFGVVAKT